MEYPNELDTVGCGSIDDRVGLEVVTTQLGMKPCATVAEKKGGVRKLSALPLNGVDELFGVSWAVPRYIEADLEEVPLRSWKFSDLSHEAVSQERIFF
jgi:hypothetical protein